LGRLERIAIFSTATRTCRGAAKAARGQLLPGIGPETYAARVKAEIVAIGTEILLGEIVDTNSAYIAQRLPELGIDLYYKSVVGDNLGRLVETLERGWTRSDLIFTTGGLGPTDDDMTREGIAALFGETPYVDEELERRLRARFAERNMPMPESNLKQAWLIPGVTAIPNPRGSAPGWWAERDGKVIISMPGVPPEMELMWANEVQPELARRSTGEVLVTRTIKTVGIGEGTVDDMARPLYATPGIGIGTYARADGVHLRVGAKAATVEEAWARIRPVEEALERIFGNAIWGRDEDTLEGSIAGLLRERRENVATMESCTGGQLASVLTDAPGASQDFAGGIVAYNAQQKIDAGVPSEIVTLHGVVSEETAKAMASAVKVRFGSSYGLSATGVLGPEPLEGIEPGIVYIGLATPSGGQHVATLNMRAGARPAVKRRAVTVALQMLRRALIGELD